MKQQETKQLTKGDIVAVYGTLRKDCSNYHSLGLRGRAKYLGEDIVKGSLYSIPSGGFPCLKEGEEDVVVDLFEIVEETLGLSLDRLEGYNPTAPQESNSFYIRSAIETLNGVPASIYVFQGGVREEDYIESGDWVQWKSSKTR